MVTVKFFHQNRIVTFYHAESVEDAKKRFQWAYGYWPQDILIENVIEEKGIKGV